MEYKIRLKSLKKTASNRKPPLQISTWPGSHVNIDSDHVFQNALQNMLDPYVLLRPVRGTGDTVGGAITDFVVEFVNSAAEHVLSHTWPSLIGMHLLEAMPKQRTSGLFDRYVQVVETGHPLVLDAFPYTETLQGHIVSMILDIRATRLENGLAITWRNVTQRRQTESDLAEMQRYIFENVEAERRKLARLLHDGPVQDLYAIDYQLHDMEMPPLASEQSATLASVQETLHSVIDVLLNTVADLRPLALAPFGLKAAIQSHVHRYREEHPETAITLDLDDDHQDIPEAVRFGLFRVYRHVIDNIERHAAANKVKISLKLLTGVVELAIEDDGVGFALPDRLVTLTRERKLGLAASYEQIHCLGGQMEINTHPGSGTRITARVPTSAQA